jgi:MFS family permease
VPTQPTPRREVDSPYAWFRLATAVLLSTIGGVGMWSVVVALPAVQAAFHLNRGAASLPYTVTLVGFALGGVLWGWVADRVGVIVPLAGGAIALGLGYTAAGLAPNATTFALAYALLIGFLGCSATFAPLVAEISHWFARRRGIAVSIVASGNYAAGTFWPPVVEHAIGVYGWRGTHVGIGVFCILTMLPLAFLLRGRPPGRAPGQVATAPNLGALGLRPGTLQAVLAIAGMCCCVAMGMPQVHIVAYCGDLGYGAQVGARMLSLMLGFGVISRVASGYVADRIGGIATLLIGSLAQTGALVLYLGLTGENALYLVSAFFGLVQGGLVPSYAIIIRECFPAREAGCRVGVVLMLTLFGMALGGWMSGEIFDLTGSYRAAFANGVAWNVANAAIAFWLLRRAHRHIAPARRMGPVTVRSDGQTGSVSSA